MHVAFVVPRGKTPLTVLSAESRVPTACLLQRGGRRSHVVSSVVLAPQAYACCGSFGDVERIFADMQERGMSLDEFGLTVLLSAYSRARPRQRERAQLVFEEYVRGGGRVTAPPLRVLRTCLGAPLCSKLLAKLGLRQQASGDS